MPKSKKLLTPSYLGELLAASPEGYFNRDELNIPKLAGDRDAVVEQAVAAGIAALEGAYVYDPVRLTAEQVRAKSALYPGSLPALKADGTLAARSIAERTHARLKKLEEMNIPAFIRLINAFEGTEGFTAPDAICTEPGDQLALAKLIEMNMLKSADGIVFDPLRISRASIDSMQQQNVIGPLHRQVSEMLSARPGQTAPRVELVEKFGAKALQKVLELGGFAMFSVPLPVGEAVWIRLESADYQTARQVALEATRPKDEDWQPALDMCGDVLKPQTHDGETRREKVLARSYTLAAAARRLGVRADTLQSAIAERLIAAFIDPEGQTRIAAVEINAISLDPKWSEAIEDLEIIRLRELKIAFGETEGKALWGAVRRAYKPMNDWVRWGYLRALMTDAPITLRQFRELYRARKEVHAAQEEERRASERQRRAEERRQERERREEERRQRDELRARLLAAFPAWQHAGRVDQRVLLHVGPTNSGKTHHALEALKQAGSGWYLAPLRLLAYEIFDRMNRDGVRCNLLTGEEHIPVEGATITAATIEMFNPNKSGECVVIDEAQMLADPDRGWAWTRALMEAQAPEIRVIAPLFARSLAERLAAAAAMPLELVEHQRLAPLAVADQPWPLGNLPPRTILVAFSRRMVLRLKTELEQYRRTVSVIYGNLPPEVRRKQAERFAAGKTEICVATDAVGMGLNLPADNVCFFELEKFDGHTIRPLSPAEVHQIGGRAGRYGLSTTGLIGACNRGNLKQLRRLYETKPFELQYARVAPDVEDLELIPGSLAHRFAQWRELQSIPDELRDVIEPADIDERIALAQMLTDKEVEFLGLPAAVQLVNAPTRESSRAYWYSCARAILAGRAMPLPPEAPMEIENDQDLEATETTIACGDIYLWLACRYEFEDFAPDEAWVRALRAEWSMSIDAALLRRLDTAARCINCRRRLPLNHRYSLCDQCYAASTRHWWR